MIEIKLKPKEERRILRGHCWIFSNELETVDTKIVPGSLCKVISSEGKVVATAMFNPHSLIAARVLLKGPKELENDFIFRRLKRAQYYRRSLGLNNYGRMCFSESDFLPGLIVDRFGEVLTVEILSAGMERLKESIIAVLKDIFKANGIFVKNDNEFRKLEGLPLKNEIIGEVPETAIACEDEIKYSFPLAGGQKTGFYYDQRENRKFLESYFKGRYVLDLHSYVGGFGIRAAVSGAKKVWGVDSSQIAVDYANKNAELNKVEKIAVFHKEDASKMLAALIAKELPDEPDFVLLDPPNLVKSKKNLKQAVAHYVKLNEMALKGLSTDGLLATSACSHHITREVFEEVIKEAVRKSGKNVYLMEYRGQSKDHPVLLGMPETEYLHFALLRVV